MNRKNLIDYLRKLSITKDPPYDPVTICHKLGIICIKTDLVQEVKSCIINYKNTPYICIDHEQSDSVKRVEISRMLGLYIFNQTDDYEFISWHDRRSHTELLTLEKMADDFAVELLLPKKLVRKAINSNKIITHEFGVTKDLLKIFIEKNRRFSNIMPII